MKKSVVFLVWLLLLGAIVLGTGGCASDPDNDSARPWNSPEGYEGNNMMENEQHPE